MNTSLVYLYDKRSTELKYLVFKTFNIWASELLEKFFKARVVVPYCKVRTAFFHNINNFYSL